MNKIFKVIYSKTRHCYVVVSELAKSHCKSTTGNTSREHRTGRQLTAMVLTALMGFTFGIAVPGTSWALDGEENKELGTHATVSGGKNNTANGTDSTIAGGSMNNTGTYGTLVAGGNRNVAASLLGDEGYRENIYKNSSTVVGGNENNSLGAYSTLVGGYQGVVQGDWSTGIAGGSTGDYARYALAAGYGAVVTNSGVQRTANTVQTPSGPRTDYDYSKISTALGYQATANQPGTISFGHDAGDVSGYEVKWTKEYDKDLLGNYKHTNADGSHIDYTKAPTITEKYYTDAYYNRLVKIADGINSHDAVTMEQMTTFDNTKANVAADNIGSKLQVVKKDGSGNTITDSKTGLPVMMEASDTEKTANESAWGQALGTGAIVNENDQLVTGGTVYNAMLNKANVAMDNITDGGKTVIRNLAKEAVKVVDGEHTYVTFKPDGNATAYAVNIKTGQVASGDGDLVTGGTVYDAIQNAKMSGGSGQPVDISGKADVSAGNVGLNFTKYSDAATTDEQKKNEKIANENAWGKALGTGKIANSDATVTDADTNGSKQLVTGNTVYKEVRPTSDGTYIKIANTTAQNLTNLDTAIQNQATDLKVNQGWGIAIANETDPATKVTKKNVISLSRNLGKDYDTTDGVNLKNDTAGTSLILGGRVEKGNSTGGQTVTGDYGALGKDSVTVGGVDNTVETTGDAAVVVGGIYNKAAGKTSAVVGGSANDAIGNESAVFGGSDNDAYETYATISGGSWNKAYGNASSVFGGSYNDVSGKSSVAVGGYGSHVYGDVSVGIAGGSTNADYALAAGNEATVTVDNGTAIGYQATANKEGTVAFGHDKDDVYYTSTWPQKATEENGKYYDANNNEITADQYKALQNADLTFNDYSKKPAVTENKYTSAAYNRLVKVADGQDAHDVVVMEQLDNAKNDLKVNAGWGINVADVTTSNNDGTETTTKNVISLNRNLGTKLGTSEKVNLTAGNTGLVLGTVVTDDFLTNNAIKDVDLTKLGATGNYAVTIGGVGNIASGKYSTALGGYVNMATGDYSSVSGGFDNTASGSYSSVSGGRENKASGSESFVAGGYQNKASGLLYSSVVGGTSNEAAGESSAVFGGEKNTASGENSSVFGGVSNKASGEDAVASGGNNNTASGEHASAFGGSNNKVKGHNASVFGGYNNSASGQESVVVGGVGNTATNAWASVFGGDRNTATGIYSAATGGLKNVVTSHHAVAVGGTNNRVLGDKDAAFGGNGSVVQGETATGIAGGSTGAGANNALSAGYQSVVTTANGTAIGYQATTNQDGTIAFGHDKGDVSGYTVTWKQRTDKDSSGKIVKNADGTTNDYTQSPTITANTYSTANYNRLVKVDDGQNAHDAVVMEQLKPYTKSDASNIGNNLKTYTVGDDGETITEVEASADAKTTNENKWGAALGTGKVADPNATGESGAEKNGSQQLVTGGTVFNETRISAKDDQGQAKTYNYLDANNSAGKNLEALDSALKTVSNSHTALTVEGNSAGKDDGKNKDVYTGKNILLHESTDKDTGKVTYDLKLAKDLTGMNSTTYTTTTGEGESATTSTTVVDGNGLTITNGPSITKDGINGGGDKITHVGSGMEKDGKGNITEASKTNAANIGDVQTIAENTTTSLTDKGLKFAANSGAEYTAKLGSTVKIQGTDKKAGHEYTADNLTTEIDKDGNIKILMDKDMSTETLAVNGKDGKDGKPGTAGSIGISGQDGKAGVGIDGKDGISIKGKDGKDGVTMKAVDGKDGTEGHIGLTGPAGTNGKDGTNAIDITVKNGYNGANGVNGKNGVDGTSLTRIVYTDKTGEHQVATMEDGLKFKGDDTTVIAKKLNNTLDIIGGADSKNLTEKNIGVNSDKDGRLNVQLAKDLKGITSISNQTTTKDGDKEVTTGAKLTLGTDGSVNVNGGKITNVGSGIEKDKAGNITEASKTNAANIGDVQTIAENTTTSLTDKGLKFAANSGAEYTAKLGSTVKIQGTDKKAGHEYTADNLTTEIDKDGNIKILMDKDMSTETLAVNGKDGKDGKPGTAGSIGISGQDGKAGVGIDGKDGISIKGKDGKDGVTMKAVDGKDGTEGHIGLTGPAGTNGKDGTNAIDITVKNGYNGANGVNGKNGVDGTSLTRIVYTDKTGEHQVATMEDGLKFKGDDTTVIAKKLNNTLDIIGGADSKNLTEKNIGVNSDKDGRLNVQLAKDLKGITSISNQKAKITLSGDGSVDVNGGKITNVGSGIEADKNGKYTVTDQNKGNAANIGDVQNMVNDAKTELTDGTNGLNKKANIDASNIGANLKGADGKTAATEAEKTKNENAWGSAIGTGKIEKDNGQLVTGKTVYDEVRPTADGSYVKKDKTTGENLSALDTQVKTNADNIAKNTESIQNITNNIKNLSDNAVQYDKDSNKSKVTLGGKDGTTITNVKDGALNDSSTEAVNGKQLYNEQQAREAADKAITEKMTNNTNEITKIKNGDFTDASKTAIHNIAKNAIAVVNGKNTTVTKVEGTDTTPTTYAVNVEGTGKVTSGDTGLISGDTLYQEVHVDKDGSYIKGSNTVGQNLSALDTGLKTTSDLIHTNDKGDTIQIGGNSTATKIDVSGKDANGNTTGRVITGVVSDANDPNSAANVGYVNGLTAANTQQIYRDMNNAYSRLDTNINRAAAGSNALAALHPLEFDPADKASFAVGYGHYHNANAAAIGAFYQPNANTMVNMGISLGNGDPGFNAGVSFKLGQGSVYNGVSKAEMAQTIQKQSEQINALEKANQKMEKENEEMKAQIKQILERLNG